jgi:two-component system, chemotaxis family, chemotaxis protein CheY
MVIPASRSIMVIEDDPDAAASMVILLTRAGHIVQTARNGRDALELLAHYPRPDLIVLDLAMPELDGGEFRWQQLADARIADVPVLIVSAVDDARVKASALRADGFLPKPIHSPELLAAVERVALPPRSHAGE